MWNYSKAKQQPEKTMNYPEGIHFLDKLADQEFISRIDRLSPIRRARATPGMNLPSTSRRKSKRTLKNRLRNKAARKARRASMK
jgi:hypothetical protein